VLEGLAPAIANEDIILGGLQCVNLASLPPVAADVGQEPPQYFSSYKSHKEVSPLAPSMRPIGLLTPLSSSSSSSSSSSAAATAHGAGQNRLGSGSGSSELAPTPPPSSTLSRHRAALAAAAVSHSQVPVYGSFNPSLFIHTLGNTGAVKPWQAAAAMPPSFPQLVGGDTVSDTQVAGGGRADIQATSSCSSSSSSPEQQQEEEEKEEEESKKEEEEEEDKQAAVWAVSDQDRALYRKLFRKFDSGGSGFVTMQQSRRVFRPYKLEQEQLYRIWRFADTQRTGKLCLLQFSLAIHLARGVSERKLALPASKHLPPCLHLSNFARFLPPLSDRLVMQRQKLTKDQVAARDGFFSTVAAHICCGQGEDSAPVSTHSHSSTHSSTHSSSRLEQLVQFYRRQSQLQEMEWRGVLSMVQERQEECDSLGLLSEMTESILSLEQHNAAALQEEHARVDHQLSLARKQKQQLSNELQDVQAAHTKREAEVNELKTAVYQCEAQHKMLQAEVNVLRREYDTAQRRKENQLFLLSQSAR